MEVSKEAVEFVKFPKIARLLRGIVITEKIDGTNAQIYISEPDSNGDMIMMAGSRNRWITPDDDNYGFANWCRDNARELMKLGPGRHFGEWWGGKIQRGYGVKEKTFSLFNTSRWSHDEIRPACCSVVPVLYAGPFDTSAIEQVLSDLAMGGSVAAPGFMNPEGVVIYHPQSQSSFKRTIKDDELPKSLV